MTRTRRPKPSAEFEAWAQETTRWDSWQERRERLQAENGGIAALVPRAPYAMEPPADWETPEGYVSPRVERKRRRYS